ncbi:MAG: hypothetical protein IJ333_09785 [Clostridia bacterium]|nr:hypothetical protein [Clostridia bacterium]
MKKKLIGSIVLIIVALFIIVNILYMTMPAMVMAISSFFIKKPPKPAVEYGEFPFRIVYKVNEEVVTIEDVLVIEYKDSGIDYSGGKYYKWNTYLKSGNDQRESFEDQGFLNALTLCSQSETTEKIWISLGSNEHYMGVPALYSSQEYCYSGLPGVVWLYNSGNTVSIGEQTLYQKFGITIIETTFSDPLPLKDEKTDVNQ